jgi:Saxitoxin biosynthesis operon protein SxtJ
MSKDKKNLLVFGYGLGLIAAVFGIGGWIKHGFGLAVIVLLLCSIILVSVTILDCRALKGGYYAWMKVSHLIGGVMTMVILSAVFFLIFTPIGFLLRLMGRDHLRRNFSKKGLTYWEKRNQTGFRKQRYHQQF